MSQPPDKQKASEHEKQLASISDAQSREAKYIHDRIGKDFVKESKRDRTKEVLGRISADWAKESAGFQPGLNDFGNALVTMDSEASRTNAMVEGSTKAKESRGQNINAALRAGKGLESTAQSSIARLAQISNEKGRQALQRKASRQAATLGAIGTVAGGAGAAYANDLGVFADKKADKGLGIGKTVTGEVIEDGTNTTSLWDSRGYGTLS